MGKFIHLVIFMLCNVVVLHAQNSIKGQIVNTENEPLSQVTVRVSNPSLVVSSNDSGYFEFTIPQSYKEVLLHFDLLGMSPITEKVALPATHELMIVMETASLTLNAVDIVYKAESGESNSSIVINKQAIEQTQAFSLIDVINTMPGKSTVAPNLHQAQTLTLRGYSGNQSGLSQYNNNNSMGVAIMVDGVQQFNDANLQTRSISKWGTSNATVGQSNGSNVSNTFAGLDLRDIPVENIEKIEVIQGVASAKYGELTDGAVIIERQAGKSPFIITTNVNGGSANLNLSKGFRISPKMGSINIGMNYLSSNEDPRDKVKTYSRYAPSLMWTKPVGTYGKNTLSMDFSTRGDEVKQDPDDTRQERSFAKNRTFKASNRFKINPRLSWLRELEFITSYSQGYQENYKQFYQNLNPQPMATKDTIGIYEGFWIPGTYMAEDWVIGKPVTATANLNLVSLFNTGKLSHRLGYGASYNFQNNGGRGVISDPERPRGSTRSTNSFDRPYNFTFTPDIHNVGIYVEDNMQVYLAGKPLNIVAGLRNDWQNGYSTLQPRVNMNYSITKKLQFNYAYGIATKAPGLAYRFPFPTYIDIPLLNLYTGQANKNIFLVYTDKLLADNSDLKPVKTIQQEAGFRYQSKFINASIFGYYKKTIDGFTTQNTYNQYHLPVYDYRLTNDGIEYWQTGDSIIYAAAGYNKVTNGLSSDMYGLEFIMQTQKIKSINTSFNFSTNYSYGVFKNSTIRMENVASAFGVGQEQRAFYAVYNRQDYSTHFLMSKIGATTHIPKLGFIVYVNADIHWMNTTERPQDDGLPIAYIDQDYRYHEIQNFDVNNPIYGHLKNSATALLNDKREQVYGYLNFSVAKEIKKNLRISINAYNFLNLRYQEVHTGATGTQSFDDFITPVSVTAGLTLKL